MIPMTIAAEANAVITAVTSALSGFSESVIADAVTAALGIAVPLVIGWFGFRFIWSKAKGALKRGT